MSELASESSQRPRTVSIQIRPTEPWGTAAGGAGGVGKPGEVGR